MNGIDISAYQGKIDGARVRNAGVEFAILRVSDKNNAEDAYFSANYNQCRKNGIFTGVYKFSYALTETVAAAEAEKTLSLIKNKEIDCGVWLDLEWEEQRKLGGRKIEKIAQAFIKVIEKGGYSCGIYCNTDWYKRVLTEKLKQYPLWIARYPSADGGVPDYELKPDVGIVWQYTSKGRVSGISGYVDRDLAWVNLPEYLKKRNEEILKEKEAAYMFQVGTLQYGSAGNDVLLFEEIMKARGYYEGALDKSYGEGCMAACTQYQKERKGAAGPVDGICGEKTWKDLIAL
ncbi:MAG: GH25 family lysozyme [Ruminococcus sp.]|jgi:GH25 family lysozyme M1 (1,4-beta-N-acetylmuramidase)